MKTYLLRRFGRLVSLFAIVALTAGVCRGADDVNSLFQMGRAAFYKGDLETAEKLLSQVAAKNPGHFETKALLAQIRSQMKPEGSLKKTYQAVILPKIEFSDVTLQEAIEGLRVLSKTASSGKVIPNFIIKDPTLGAKTINLNLNNVPLTEVIQYLADVVGGRAVYDKHAVIFTGAAG